MLVINYNFKHNFWKMCEKCKLQVQQMKKMNYEFMRNSIINVHLKLRQFNLFTSQISPLVIHNLSA